MALVAVNGLPVLKHFLSPNEDEEVTVLNLLLNKESTVGEALDEIARMNPSAKGGGSVGRREGRRGREGRDGATSPAPSKTLARRARRRSLTRRRSRHFGCRRGCVHSTMN